MNTFESTLTAVLRDEAQELTMSIDQNRAAEELHSRLDDIEVSRRRWYVGVGAGVAAAVALIVFLGVIAKPVAQAPPADPGPSASATGSGSSYATSEFRAPFSVAIPDWIATRAAVTSESTEHVTWSVCSGGSCTRQVVVRYRWLVPPTDTAPGRLMLGYDDYVAYLRSLEASGDISLSDVASTTVDGRSATVMTLLPSASFAGELGCETGGWQVDDCWRPAASTPVRVAVIQHEDYPLVARVETPAGNPDADAAAQFDGVLASIRFTAAPADAIVGRWQTSFTRSQVRDVLTSAGLGSTVDRVLKEFPGTGDPLTWQLWVDRGIYELYRVDGSTANQYDFQRYSLDGRRLTADPQNRDKTRVVFDVNRDGATLGLTLVSDSTPDLAPGVPDEAMQRALYTTATWTRMS